MTDFVTPTALIDTNGPIRVLLIGCGGTGSEVIDGLARLHAGLLALGHAGGLDVTAVDGDTVSAANVGRQRFSPSDVGRNKAAVLIHRFNLFYGLTWRSVPVYFDAERHSAKHFHILITCVDKASVRVRIAKNLSRRVDGDPLWLDYGNGENDAQVILGHLCHLKRKAPFYHLPNVYDLFPELTEVNDHSAPSCSLAEALRTQDLFINRAIANAGLAILWSLLKNGKISHHGVFLNVATAISRPLPIDETTWSFMGYEQRAKAMRRQA